jgi:hypothetical protein
MQRVGFRNVSTTNISNWQYVLVFLHSDYEKAKASSDNAPKKMIAWVGIRAKNLWISKLKVIKRDCKK